MLWWLRCTLHDHLEQLLVASELAATGPPVAQFLVIALPLEALGCIHHHVRMPVSVVKCVSEVIHVWNTSKGEPTRCVGSGQLGIRNRSRSLPAWIHILKASSIVLLLGCGNVGAHICARHCWWIWIVTLLLIVSGSLHGIVKHCASNVCLAEAAFRGDVDSLVQLIAQGFAGGSRVW